MGDSVQNRAFLLSLPDRLMPYAWGPPAGGAELGQAAARLSQRRGRARCRSASAAASRNRRSTSVIRATASRRTLAILAASITGGWIVTGRRPKLSKVGPVSDGREFGCCAMAQLRQERSRVLRSSLRSKSLLSEILLWRRRRKVPPLVAHYV